MSDFAGAYDAALAAWPVPPEIRDVPTRFGTTRVYAAGPVQGRPMVLLPGGGMTAASFYATVGPLVAQGIRVYAVDIICDRGRSVPSSTPVLQREDLVEWLRLTLGGLDLTRADFAGHSYGGWIAAHQAIHAPDTVDRLVLIDASIVFAGHSRGYLLRALPLFIGRDRQPAIRRLLAWETGGRAEGLWLAVMSASSTGSGPKLVFPKRPTEAELRTLPERTLVLVAGRARSHDPNAIAATARRLLPNAVVEVLPEATHHTVPAQDADAVNDAIRRFLA